LQRINGSVQAVLQQTLSAQERPDAHCEVVAQAPPCGTRVAVAVGVIVGVLVGVAVAVRVAVFVAVAVIVAVAVLVAVAVAVGVSVGVADGTGTPSITSQSVKPSEPQGSSLTVSAVQPRGSQE
jgi:hypothetical protein